MSYLLSPDVTDPRALVNLVDPADGHVVEAVFGGIEFDRIETDAGISRLVLADDRQIEQYPGLFGGFSYVAGTGAYGRCTVDGSLVAFKTRPEDHAFVYTLKRLP